MTTIRQRADALALLLVTAMRPIAESAVAGPLVCWLIRRFGGKHLERATERNEFGAMRMVCVRCGAVRYARKRRRFKVVVDAQRVRDMLFPNDVSIPEWPGPTPLPNAFNTITEADDHAADDPRHTARG